MDDWQLKTFTDAFIEALYFTETGDVGQPDSSIDISNETRLNIEADCRSFWRRFGAMVTADLCSEAFQNPISQAGHDFWMTRNGHGVGFWEDEWPEAYRDLFTTAAQNYGDFDVYDGDDFQLYD